MKLDIETEQACRPPRESLKNWRLATAYRDMELDLRDVVNMSAIVSGLVEELPGKDKKLAFAVYHLERMLQQMEAPTARGGLTWGVGTGRRNKSTAARSEGRQTALQQPPPVVTTWVKVINDGSKWSWAMEHYGVSYTSGTPPATGPAVFNEYSTAAAAAEANYLAVRVMRNDLRRQERAALSAMTKPSPGQ